MKNSAGIFLILVLCDLTTVFCQNVDNPNPVQTIHIDTMGKADNPIPFDHPFYIQRDKMHIEENDAIQLYRVKYKKGQRILYPDKHHPGLATPDYVFKKSDIFLGKDQLTLIVPPLKPNKDFDIMVLRKCQVIIMIKRLELMKA